MPGPAQAYRLMPWAWSAAWLLTGLGISISDIYSSPSRSLFAYFVLGALGWGAAGYVTVLAAGHAPGRGIRLAGWAVASLTAILLGPIWLYSWNMAFLGPIVAVGVAGTIGGVAGSVRPGVWRLVSGLLMGVVFLLFATVGFYFNYFTTFSFTPIAQMLGNAGANAFIWTWPGALCGLGAGFLARRIILGRNSAGPTGVST